MILIVAAAADTAAAPLASAWRAACLRPADLSMPGWRHFVAAEGSRGSVVVGGTIVPESEVTGVLTRTTWISPYELPVIAEADRAYVATEMSAFLLSWLSSLDCPVVNRPMPGCLAGPPWRTPQWMAAAAVSGLKIPTFGRMHEACNHAVMLTVVGTPPPSCSGSRSTAAAPMPPSLAQLPSRRSTTGRSSTRYWSCCEALCSGRPEFSTCGPGELLSPLP